MEEAYSSDMDRFRERTTRFTKGVDAISGKEYQLKSLEVPARGALVLDLK
ncbi:MAG: cyclomaltodextrinase C-terminal domain-containing protein [Bacteroidales bacterium]|nr:cyclomaltodextrinase C-terminal domain-containing protein [Bacteroidales bacterium]